MRGVPRERLAISVGRGVVDLHAENPRRAPHDLLDVARPS